MPGSKKEKPPFFLRILHAHSYTPKILAARSMFLTMGTPKGQCSPVLHFPLLLC